jgi:hypothetical protein
MNEYFARLNSTERRFVVVVMLIVFAGVNAWLVWPKFGDWKKNQSRMFVANNLIKSRETKIAQGPEFERQIKKFESEGAAVPPEDQQSDFVRAINNQAAASGVAIMSINRLTPRTNQFFLELGQALTLQTDDEHLVDFLYNLGAGNSLVRVRGLSLNPDPPRQNLRVNVTLIGSYQKKLPTRAAPPTTTAKSAAPAPTTNQPAARNPQPAVPAPTGTKKLLPPPASGPGGLRPPTNS